MSPSSHIESRRRQYNQFVVTEYIEDYALRYTPRGFRRWSEFLVANTAIGSISFLALEAIGASIALNYGFLNAFWGILAASVIIFIMGLPICYHAAKNNIDIDLLTRSAGFGYLGSTITSLIYASFCFIFFALEAAIMAQALQLYLHMPLAIGYALSSIIIIPIVFYGMTAIHRLQMLTQPVWLLLMILPFILILDKDPQLFTQLLNFQGNKNNSAEFSLYYFGFALGISLSLIPQIGEQVDYLRFMPEKTAQNRWRWWAAVLFAGPGWIILGFAKQIGGIFLASLVILSSASLLHAREPVYMYLEAYKYVIQNPDIAILVSFVFVMISQIKINVTNAYAGSLAWSNFFSRLTHAHPGRIVWLVFNIVIALLLMEMGVFDVLENILGLYSNIAIAWIATLFADLAINKPFGLSPRVIEFKRAFLYNFNPVGIFSTLIASMLSLLAFSGLLGEAAQAFSSLIALGSALIMTPLLAWFTKGKYYIARKADNYDHTRHYTCAVCGADYVGNDVAHCSHYNKTICSLCCSLEARCHDHCKPDNEFDLNKVLYQKISPILGRWIKNTILERISRFTIIYLGYSILVALIFWSSYFVKTEHLNLTERLLLQNHYQSLYLLFELFGAIACWFVILLQESHKFVENELLNLNQQLENEISERIATEKQLNLSQNNLSKAQRIAHIGSWNLNLKTNHLEWSDEIFNIFGIDKHKFQASYEGFINTIHPDDRDKVNQAYMDSVKIRTPYSIEHRLLMPDGTIKYVHERGETYYDDNGEAIESVGTVLDITEITQARELIQRQAFYDSLTNLPNRFLVLDRLKQMTREAARNHHKIAVLFIDLDDFKKVNDTMGHDTGDQLLIEVARRLSGLIRKEDTVGRLGGDEFIILLNHLKEGSESQNIAQKVINELSRSIVINNNSLVISASIGIALFPDDGQNQSDLLKNADSAMYHAKEMGRNTFAYFTEQMNREIQRRLEIEQNLLDSLNNSEFEIHYQPKVSVQSGKIIGAEALLRWQSAKLGAVSPAEFISIAEQNGMIVPIGYWILEQVTANIARWKQQFGYYIKIAINLSPRQFRDPELIESIIRLSNKHQIPSECIEFELTEGILISGHKYIEEALQKLHQAGFKLSMDDFGTGYSSLSYLRSYPFDIIKIDQSFIRDLTIDEDDRELVNAAIAMAHGLKMEVVAEGVETEQQLAILKQTPCDYAQGYLFSKPITVAQFSSLIEQQLATKAN